MHRPVSPWTLPADLRRAIAEGGAGGGVPTRGVPPSRVPSGMIVRTIEQSSSSEEEADLSILEILLFVCFCGKRGFPFS